MLVLTRKIGEEIVIDDVINIKVLEIRNGQIKLGIEAPKEHRIMRKELVDGTR